MDTTSPSFLHVTRSLQLKSLPSLTVVPVRYIEISGVDDVIGEHINPGYAATNIIK